MTESEARITSLLPRPSSDLAALDELDNIILGGEFNVEIVDDPAQISRDMVAQLLAAETDEDLEVVGEAQPWQDLEGIPVEIHGFRWRPSDMEGTAVYLVVNGTRLDDGESVVLTCGSLNVIGALSNLARRGRIPGAIRILRRSSKPTKAGFYPLNLTRTDEERARARAERIERREREEKEAAGTGAKK